MDYGAKKDFLITIEIVVEVGYLRYEHTSDVFRSPFVGTLDEAKRYVSGVISSTSGHLIKGVIERKVDGLCGSYFHREFVF